MKKTAAIVTLIVALVAVLWTNKRSIALLLFRQRQPPQKISFHQTDVAGLRIYHVPSGYLTKNLARLREQIATNLREAEGVTRASFGEKVNVYLYNNWEEKGNHSKDIRIATAHPADNSIRLIVNEKYDGVSERVEYGLLLSKRYGKPHHPAVARYATAALAGVWNQKSLEDWARFLLQREIQPNFPEFLDQTSRESEFILYPWNAVMGSFVRERFGWDAFIAWYKSGEFPNGYENAWKQYVTSLKPNTKPNRTVVLEFQKGISYAYANGYRSGYATKRSKQSLGKLKQLGVQWVAAIPYGFMRSHDDPLIHTSGHNITGESDESMFALADDARALQMKVMMKPQIWINHESWPGRVSFANDSEWAQWFSSYEKWIIHYAIISELMKADLFCIGTELVQTTLKHPERWKRMISRIRQVYHGPLVYAANYGPEFEQITFWPALDYLGVDNYYSVRRSPAEGVTEMKKAFQLQKEKLKTFVLRYKKPLLFTEIGYMANEGAGTGSREFEFTEYDEKAQEICYRLALETYFNEPWFAGMYWWKWFSDPGDIGPEADAHSPHGRPAEKTLREWYGKQRAPAITPAVQ